MKSVGEVMGIGRNFTEALQKACQSLENGKVGLGADGKNWTKTQDILDSLNHPSWDRIFKIKDAMELGVPIHTIQKLTQIDIWFLYQIQDLVKLEKEIKRFTINNIPKELLLLAKTKGFSDLQLAYLLGRIEEDEV